MPEPVLQPAPVSTKSRGCASMKRARAAASLRSDENVPGIIKVVTVRRAPIGRSDGQALFLLLGDERRKDHDAVAERLQLSRARHAHADPDARARSSRRRRN